MTSTNDEKDEKSIQTSGPKGKTHYIELYKSLEAGLSGDCDLRERTKHLCDAWRRIHSLCQHSTPSTHTHFLSWLQRHTARTVLQTEWQSPESKDEHASLEEAINNFIEETKNSTASRDGESTAWESQLVQRGEWFKRILPNPWGHPVLRVLLDPRGKPPCDDEVLEWLKEERGVMFVTRLRQLAASKCDDLAMSLASAVMDRVRAAAAAAAAAPDQHELADHSKDVPKADAMKPTFEDILNTDAGFTVDVWELLTDIEFVLLHKGDSRSRCIDLAKQTPLRHGYQLVERLQSRLKSSPREKKLWKNAKEVATLIAQVIIARCMVVPVCTGASRSALYCCTRSLVRLLAPARLPAAAAALAAPAATAHHLHTLAAAVDAQSTEEMKPFVCELYVRAITAGMNELERLKLKTEKESEARSTEQTLASWFTALGALLAGSERVRCECTLTAFSVHPTPHMYDRIKAAPPLSPVAMDVQEAKEQITSDYGSWANDSRSQTNFVKTSETLNLKQTNHQTNVLSTAILTEGEALGLSAELCMDIAVLLAGPRVKTLSWDMDREVLLENCRTYMERTHGGTRALTTELKYLNLDPRNFQHLPEEVDDENDIYYGIEKGYEHLVEFQEPEQIWDDLLNDPERTESAYSDSMDNFHTGVRRKKKNRQVSTCDEDSDPLSLVAEAKKMEKKKERPHSKERSKDRKKKSDIVDPLEIKESRREKRKEKKRERKERKRKEKAVKAEVGMHSSLSRLIGMKVSKVGDTNIATVSATDSDYDSQGKSSLNSLNMEGNETDVLFDGLFSMDELKSPEKDVESSDKLGLLKNNELCLENGSVAINMVSARVMDEDKLRNATYIPTNVTLPKESVVRTYQPVPDRTQNLSPSLRTATEDVKNSITKLLEFRRQKNVLMNNEYRKSQSQTSSLHSLSEVKTTNVIMRPEIIPKTPNAIINPNVSLQTQISPKVVTIPDIPKMYIDKKQAEQLAELKNEINSLLLHQSKIPNTSPVIQFARKSTGDKANDTMQAQSGVPTKSIKIKDIVQLQRDRFNMHSSSQQYPVNDSLKQANHQPHANIPTPKPVHTETASQSNFQNFLKELQESINAGTGIDLSTKPSNQSVIVKKEMKPVSRVTPVLPVMNKAEPKTSPQCAKQFALQKKTDNSLNTFSRLSYMHKNKQSDMKTKQGVEASELLTQSRPQVSSELNRAVVDYKDARLKYLQSKNDITVSRVERAAPIVKSNDDIKSLMKKSEKMLQTTSSTKNPNYLDVKPSMKKSEKTSVIKEYSLLSSLLNYNQSGISKTPANRNADAFTSSETPLVPEVPKISSFSEKDHNDLLLLLRQKTKLNAPFSNINKELGVNPSPFTQNSNVASTSNKCKPMPNLYVPKQFKETQIHDGNQVNVPMASSMQNSTEHQSKSINVIKSVKRCIQTVDLPNKIVAEVDNIITAVGHAKGNIVKPSTTTDADAGKQTDWESVMNAILAQKTPSRGPNALDIALNKDSFAKAYADSLRNQRIVTKKPVGETSINRTATDAKTYFSTFSPVAHNNNPSLSTTPIKKINKIRNKVNNLKSSSTTGSKSRKNSNITISPKTNTPVLSKTTKDHLKAKNCNPETSKQASRVDIPKSMLSDVQRKQYTRAIPKDVDPFISGIPNSDYDLLEELMDDDLRQEIGELSSDEESYNSMSHGILKEAKTIDNRVCDVLNSRKNMPSAEKTAADPLCLNARQNSHATVKKTVIQPSSKKCDGTKKPVDGFIKVTKAKPLDRIDSKTLGTASQSSNVTQYIPKSTNKAITPTNDTPNINTNVVTPNRMPKMDPTNVFVSTVPQQTALQNVVLIGSELVYDPYAAVHTPMQTGVSHLCDNPYNMAINNVPNMTVYQTTQLTNPVINSLIIGSAISMPVPTINSALNVSATALHSNIAQENEIPSAFTEPNNETVMERCDENDTNSIQTKKYPIVAHPPHKDNVHYAESYKEEAESNPVAVHQSVDSIVQNAANCNEEAKNNPVAVQQSAGGVVQNAVNTNIETKSYSMYVPEDIVQNDFNAKTKRKCEFVATKLIENIVEDSVSSKMAVNSDSVFDLSHENINLQLEYKPCLDFNSNKNCERIVLSQVQEKLELFANEKMESKTILLDTDIKKSLNDRQRLNDKRMAIINREIYHHSDKQPIPLHFIPLRRKSEAVECKQTEIKNKNDVKKEEIGTTKVNIKLDAPQNTEIQNINDLQELNQEANSSALLESNENCHENTSNQSQCRRILLRSSNKLKTNPTSSIVTPKDPVGRKTKVRLKASVLGPATTAEETLDDNNKNDNNIKNSERRVSKRILNKSSTKTIDDEKDVIKAHKVKDDEDKKLHDKTKSNKITIDKSQNPAVSSSLNDVPYIDFENELLGSKIPRTNTPDLNLPKDIITINAVIKNTLSQKEDQDIKINDKLDVTLRPKVTELHHHLKEPSSQKIENEKESIKDVSKRGLEDISHNKIEDTVPILIHKTDTCEKPHQNHVPKTNKLNSNNPNITMTKDSIDLVSKTKFKFVEEIDLTKSNVDKSSVGHSIDSVPIIPHLKIPEQLPKESSVHRNSHAKKLFPGRVSCNSLIGESESKNIAQHKFEKNKVKSYKNIIQVDDKEALHTNATPDFHNKSDIPQSYKDGIIIEPLPDLNKDDPSKQCVRIKLPNGRVFKATVHGSANINFDNLFEDPAVKTVLLNSLTNKKRYTLNVRQVSTFEKSNKIVSTEIVPREFQKAKNIPSGDIETVNLLSDDEDDCPSQIFRTEFGKYKMHSLNKDTFTRHQEKFNRKCYVKLKRESFEQKPHCGTQRNSVILNHTKVGVQADSSIENILISKLACAENFQDALPAIMNIGQDDINKNMSETLLLENTENVIVPDIIQIDDSSNDSITLLKQNPVLVEHSNKKFDPESKITTFKNLLLQDFGVKETALVAQDNNNVNIQQNEEQVKEQLTSQVSDCFEKGTIKCDNLVRKQYEHQKVINETCFIKLIRCDHLIELYVNPCERSNIDSNSEDRVVLDRSNDSSTEVELDDEISVLSQPVSRRGSFSILNDFSIIDDNDVTKLKPLESEPDRTSPVMEIYEIMASLCKKSTGKDNIAAQPIRLISNTVTYFLSCDSDWFNTKPMMHLQNVIGRDMTKRPRVSAIQNCVFHGTVTSPIHLDESYYDNEFPTKTFCVPNLVTLVTTFFQDNSVIYKHKRITESKKNIAFKRKIISTDKSTVANKISKFGLTSSDSQPDHNKSSPDMLRTYLEKENSQPCTFSSTTIDNLNQTNEDLSTAVDNFEAADLAIETPEKIEFKINENCNFIPEIEINEQQKCKPIYLASNQCDIMQFDSQNDKSKDTLHTETDCERKICDNQAEVIDMHTEATLLMCEFTNIRTTAMEKAKKFKPCEFPEILMDCELHTEDENNQIKTYYHNKDLNLYGSANNAQLLFTDTCDVSTFPEMSIDSRMSCNNDHKPVMNDVTEHNEECAKKDISECNEEILQNNDKCLIKDYNLNYSNDVEKCGLKSDNHTDDLFNIHNPAVSVTNAQDVLNKKDVKNIIEIAVKEIDSNITMIGEYDTTNKNMCETVAFNKYTGIAVARDCEGTPGQDKVEIVMCEITPSVKDTNDENIESTPGTRGEKIMCEIATLVEDNTENAPGAKTYEITTKDKAPNITFCRDDENRPGEEMIENIIGEKDKSPDKDISEMLNNCTNILDHQYTIPRGMNLTTDCKNMKKILSFEVSDVNVRSAEEENKSSCGIFKTNGIVLTEREVINDLDEEIVEMDSSEIIVNFENFTVGNDSCKNTDLLPDEQIVSNTIVHSKINESGVNISKLSKNIEETNLTDDSKDHKKGMSYLDSTNLKRQSSICSKSVLTSREKNIDKKKNNGEVSTPSDLSTDVVLEKYINFISKEDSGLVFKGVEYEDPEEGTCYIFPFVEDTENSKPVHNDLSATEEFIQIIQKKCYSDVAIPSDNNQSNTDEVPLKLIVPKITYSKQLKSTTDTSDSKIREKRCRKNLKRKLDMTDSKSYEKKYRKGKNIDYPKITITAMADSSYVKEFRRLFDYCSSLKFSYSRPFHKEYIDVHEILKNWPIQKYYPNVLPGETVLDNTLFIELENIEVPNIRTDPLTQSLAEEIVTKYNESEYSSCEIDETNFNMGFGERSGRVIQNLEGGGGSSKFSAATLSDVKQSQPFLLSGDNDNSTNYPNIQDQIEKIRRSITHIQLRDKVRSFFRQTNIELNYNWINDNKKGDQGKHDTSNFPFGLNSTEFFQPCPIETIVQVVQVGQLPVSAAAQNPVTCDPRVTQVSNVSPSHCSAENSPHDDPQSAMKTEYTELTTADITLPLVHDYAQHNQIMTNQTQEATNLSMTDENIPIETEIKSEVKIELMEETPEEKEDQDECCENDEVRSFSNNNIIHNVEYSYDTSNTNTSTESDSIIQNVFHPTEKLSVSETFSEQKKSNGPPEKTDQIAHAMNAAGITTTPEVPDESAHELVNILSQKIRPGAVSTTQTATNSYPKTTSINAMALQQALAQILPPPLNQTNVSESNQQNPHQHSSSLTSQVLHITHVQGKNSSGNQITLVDNSQKSVINAPNATPVLHIVQNKSGTGNAATNGTSTPQSNSFSGLSLVDTGLQQGGNQLLHIVNTGNQKNNATGQLLKRVNLLTNLTNAQGSNEQKMVQFVCKSADGKIQLNSPHQRSMVLRLQPIETPNVQAPTKSAESQDLNPTSNINSVPGKETINSQQEIKSRSVYEENYAKFIQSSSNKSSVPEKSTSLPKFNQAFGKQVFQDTSQKQTEVNSNLPPVVNNTENTECQSTDNTLNLEHISQINSPPLLLRKSPAQTTQAQPNLVQQIKQNIGPMNIQTMHGGVIYTRQIPVNIGGGQTINLITVPSTELIDDSAQKQQSDIKFVNQNDIEPSIIKIVPQSHPAANEIPKDENTHAGVTNETAHNPQPQPVLTQMRIKLPMLSKAPQMVSGTRVVRPSFLQIQRNVIGGANQPVYQQLVLTAAPPLGQQTLRLPQTQTSRPIKVPTESQSSTESQMSSSTLEQLREFDLVLEQVKERSTVQPNSTNNNTTFPKLHTPSSDATDGTPVSSTITESTKHVLYSIGNNQPLNVAYVNRKAAVASSSFIRSPDSSGMADSSSSSTHVQIPHTVTADATPAAAPAQTKSSKVHSKPKPRPKAASNPPSTLKFHNTPPKPSTQKPLEDEQTTQRILYILAEYKEQVENSPDKDKPAPRRRTNPPSNPGSSKRKKSSRRCGRDSSPVMGDDGCRTMGSEDSSCGTSQGDCNESCLESHSPQDSPRKVVRKLSFEHETPVNQARQQPQRNVIVADGQTITVARGTSGKPATAVLMPANYILPVSMVKGGQQIAIVTNRGPKLLTVGGGEGGASGTLLLQRLIGPAGLKPVLARPGVRHVRLPTAALHNLQAFNLAPATTVQPPDSTASPAPGPNPPDLVETRATSSPWADRESQELKPERGSSPDDSGPWNLPSAADPHDYIYEETVRSENLDRTVLDPIPDRYSPDMEAQRIFDKMFDVDSKKSYIDSPRCGYDIDASDCDDKAYHQVVHKKDGSSHRQHRLTHVSAAALRHKYAILEHELRLQKSLSEECEDLGVDSPSASELFPEAELLFSASPAHDHTQDQAHHSQTPQPTLLSQSGIPQPDMDDQIATDQLLPRVDLRDRPDLNLGLEDVGIVTVSEDGMQATIAVDQEEFARSHPNTTFHSEPTEEGEVQPFTISGIKGRHITSTIFHANRAPGTVLMTAPQATVISQTTAETSGLQSTVKYTDIDNMINSLPAQHPNLSSVLAKDAGLTRFDSILTDSRELHLSNTASAIVHSTGNATQVIRRVCYDEDKRDARYLIDEPDALIAGDDAKMIAEDSSRDATMESMPGDADDDRSSPERHTELFWESNSASERSESRRPLDFSSDSDKCCKSPSFDETNSTDSSGVGAHMRLDSVIKEARGVERSGSADGSSADDTHPPLRTYPPKRAHRPVQRETERSMSGKTRAGERSPDSLEGRRRASARGVVKRGCQCCNGSPAPPRPKKSRQRKPTLDFTSNN